MAQRNEGAVEKGDPWDSPRKGELEEKSVGDKSGVAEKSLGDAWQGELVRVLEEAH